jgi:hypothetical protein
MVDSFKGRIAEPLAAHSRLCVPEGRGVPNRLLAGQRS